jgi:hypothetical protein
MVMLKVTKNPAVFIPRNDPFQPHRGKLEAIPAGGVEITPQKSREAGLFPLIHPWTMFCFI